MAHKTIKKSIQLTLSLTLTALIAFSTITGAPPTYAISFSDIDNHWAKSYIEKVSSYDVVSGYYDGTFKPNVEIQRIEFLAIVLNALDIEVRPVNPNEYWGQPYIEAALEHGITLSNEYGDMEPDTFNKSLTREEMASIVIRAYDVSGGKIDPLALEEARLKLSDFDTVTPVYYDYAITAVALDFMSGYSNGTFAPTEKANRAQAAVLSYKLLVKLGIMTDASLSENIMVSKNTLNQGDLLKITVLHVDTPSLLTVEQDVYPEFQWVDTGDALVGYMPTNYNTPTGAYALKFTNTQTGAVTTKEINVTKRAFKVQNLTVSSGTDTSTRTDDAYTEYYKYFNPSHDLSSQVKYYTEPFIIPAKGKVTTEFGESRVVNGSLTSYRHAGIDIAAPRNADVLATNTGKVMLAMPLTLTGNSIVLDHGEGLFSVYFHLEKLMVKDGDMVTRGQTIGTVGSTGFSTGPHLHFTMSYYRFNIEPGYWIYGQSITKDNYKSLMK